MPMKFLDTRTCRVCQGYVVSEVDRYCILSHTWLPHKREKVMVERKNDFGEVVDRYHLWGEEVTFVDMDKIVTKIQDLHLNWQH
jgi:hypothetical protein